VDHSGGVDLLDVVTELDAIDRSVSRNHVFQVDGSVFPSLVEVGLLDTITFQFGSLAGSIVSGTCPTPDDAFPSSPTITNGNYTVAVAKIKNAALGAYLMFFREPALPSCSTAGVVVSLY
jgi:hypothetical protein